MIIDLSSPNELRGYELMHDDAGAVRAYIDLFNVTDDTVSGYNATVRWIRDETKEESGDYVSVDRIAIPGGGLFRLVLSNSAIRFADRFEMYFSRVSFENGSVWEPKDGDLVDVTEFNPLEDEQLDRLIEAAGVDAVTYPETQDNFWRCVCGRINPLESELCARCRRERNYVLTELNRKNLNLDDAAQKQRRRRIVRSVRSRSDNQDLQTRTQVYTALIVIVTLIFLALSVFLILF